jgi:hypothetical protein
MNKEETMASWRRLIGGAVAGAVVGGIAAAIVTYLAYTLVFRGGASALDNQMIPIFGITVSIGGLIGIVAGAARAFTGARPSGQPRPPLGQHS